MIEKLGIYYFNVKEDIDFYQYKYYMKLSSKINILLKSIYDNDASFLIKAKLGLCNEMNDEEYLKKYYKAYLGKDLNLDNPVTFNEKLQWLKLNDRKDIYTVMVDKFAVKSFIGKKLGFNYVIPTIDIWDSVDSINFDKLPEQFVLKCTHDSGSTIVCKNKHEINTKKIKNFLSKKLKKNFFYYGREWPYKNVKPQIIAEVYMEDFNTNEVRDYKFFCFNGKVSFFKIDFDRFISHKANYYDLDCKILPFGELVCPPDFSRSIEIPRNIELMINLAEIISKDIKFLRVDFYEINNKVYFGENTFYPASGVGAFIPSEWDSRIGKLIDLD